MLRILREIDEALRKSGDTVGSKITETCTEAVRQINDSIASTLGTEMELYRYETAPRISPAQAAVGLQDNRSDSQASIADIYHDLLLPTQYNMDLSVDTLILTHSRIIVLLKHCDCWNECADRDCDSTQPNSEFCEYVTDDTSWVLPRKVSLAKKPINKYKSALARLLNISSRYICVTAQLNSKCASCSLSGNIPNIEHVKYILDRYAEC